MNATRTNEILPEFRKYPEDAYLILQIKDNKQNHDEMFTSIRGLARVGKTPDPSHYEPVYTGQLTSNLVTHENCIYVLDSLYEVFNSRHPEDFRGHSLSVSDVVALKLAGETRFYFVDSAGFQELPSFGNYLLNTEMTLEDDYGMLDGIVNNGTKETEKVSVLNQLREKPTEVTGRIPRKHSCNPEIGG